MSEQNTGSSDSGTLDLSFFGDILQELSSRAPTEPNTTENLKGTEALELDDFEGSEDLQFVKKEAVQVADDSFEDDLSEHEAWMKKILLSSKTEVSIIDYPDIPIKINHAKLLPKLEVKEETGTDPFIESLQKERKQREEESKKKAEQRAQKQKKEDEELRNWNVVADNLVKEMVDNGIEHAKKACKSVKIMKTSPKSK